MVWDYLLRTSYGKDGCVGIQRLLKKKVHIAAYLLHEVVNSRSWTYHMLVNGTAFAHISLAKSTEKSTFSKEFWLRKINEEKSAEKLPTERQLLFDTWAIPKRFYKYQPITLILKYFGKKVAIYFAWLGYYTYTLIPASLAGIICILYGWGSLVFDEPSQDVCDTKPNGMGTTVMCPYGRLTQVKAWNLTSSCRFSQRYSGICSVHVHIWATMFLEFWKRRQVELAWDWDMHDADSEEDALRPEYQIKVKTQRINPITQEPETFLPTSQKLLRLLRSVGAVIFFVIAIFLLDNVYQRLAWILTKWEFPRTEPQFEDSYTFKVFLFHFINYYSALFHVAFFKGRFTNVVRIEKTEFLGYPWEAIPHLANVTCNPAYDSEYTSTWWYVLVARLAFVLAFEHVVFLTKGLVAYIIPDVPERIFSQMQRERYLARQALYKRAFAVAKGGDDKNNNVQMQAGDESSDQDERTRRKRKGI